MTVGEGKNDESRNSSTPGAPHNNSFNSLLGLWGISPLSYYLPITASLMKRQTSVPFEL
jgi:hypothetical protein